MNTSVEQPTPWRVALVAGLVLAAGALGVVGGKATSAPAVCREAVLAVDAVFESSTALQDATQDEMADRMAETGMRAGEYSALRAQCLGQ